MTAPALPFLVDGVTARLDPAPQRSLALGPGHMGRGGAAGQAVWDAGRAVLDLDLFAAFWAHDAGQIDWLAGFLCDQAMIDWFDRLANPPEPEEEPEELYARASMNTLESTVADR